MAEDTKTAIIATFGRPDEAERWLVHAHKSNYKVAEGIVINRDAQTGKIHKHLASLPGVAAGAGVGAVGAGVIAALFPPVLLAETLALAVAGAIAGAGAVALKDEIIDRRAFDEVADSLEPGQSALIVVLDADDAAKLDSEIEGYAKKWTQDLSSP